MRRPHGGVVEDHMRRSWRHGRRSYAALVAAWMKSCGDDGRGAHWLLPSLCPEGALDEDEYCRVIIYHSPEVAQFRLMNQFL